MLGLRMEWNHRMECSVGEVTVLVQCCQPFSVGCY